MAKSIQKVLIGRIILSLPVVILFFLVLLNFSWSNPQFHSYLPQKVAPIWVNLCTLILFLFAFEWGTKGETVKTLTDINEGSPGRDKLASAIFMGLVMVAAAIVIGGS